MGLKAAKKTDENHFRRQKQRRREGKKGPRLRLDFYPLALFLRAGDIGKDPIAITTANVN